MHTETRTEIVVFAGIAGMVALWFFLSRGQAVAAQSVDALPIGATDGSQPFNPADSLSTPTSALPATFNIGGSGPFNIGGSSINGGNVGGTNIGGGGGGGCGCNTCADGGTGLTFGTTNDLSAYLAANPSLIPTQDQVSSWA